MCFASSTIDSASKISKKFSFIDIDSNSDDIAKYILNYELDNKLRSEVEYDELYDIKNSSKKLQDYYKENL